ncbi:MinD/ParA family protein [Orenia marismortui]|uniref:MinD/ParA family protein n=1 Tax=Orenia marismortui TaxID=46469 RepID=UPI000365AAFD|nr:MinD/ParA family protein [Orenia marismortui]
MKDQASKLRSLVQNVKKGNDQSLVEKSKENDKGAYIYTITSGKGGVGKSNFTANLSLALKKQGKEVVIFDADLGMANLDVILGVTPRYNLEHVIQGRKSIEEIMVQGPEGLSLIPGGSGIQELANLSQYQINNLINAFIKIGEKFDIILIDTGAGLAHNVVNFILGADEVIVISTPEPTSITDAYGVIKVISNQDKNVKVKLVVNQSENEREGERIAKRLIKTANNFLNLDIELLGVLPKDNAVVKSVMARSPFLLEFPRSKIARSINNTASKLIDTKVAKKSQGIRGLFNKLLGF